MKPPRLVLHTGQKAATGTEYQQMIARQRKSFASKEYARRQAQARKDPPTINKAWEAAVISAFGIDHGSIAKAATTTPAVKKPKKAAPVAAPEAPRSSGHASFGRHFTTQVFPTVHGLVAGRKGRKLRAAGTEFGAGTVGGIGGSLVGAGLGAATRRPQAAMLGATLGGAGGSRGGLAFGVEHANKKGYYKKQTD